MTVLSGLVPSLLAALSVLVLIWWVWACLLAGLVSGHEAIQSSAIVSGLAAIYLFVSELTWRNAKKSEPNAIATIGYCVCAIAGTALLALGYFFWKVQLHPFNEVGFAALKHTQTAFLPAIALGAATVILLLLRTLVARFCYLPQEVSFLIGVERAVTRFVGLTSALLALAVLWWVAGWLLVSSPRLGVTGTSAAASIGLFFWVRNWLAETPKETRGGNLLRAAFGILKRATPKVLATVAWMLLFVLVGAGVRWSLGNMGPAQDWQFWLFPGSSVLIIVLVLLLFDPARVGMHEFYRSRISRCYLGASNTGADDTSDSTEKRTFGEEALRAKNNRFTSERVKDDVTLGDLRRVEGEIRPLHLICTAANDISGDAVGTLYRGAKSAVISIHGVSLGDETRDHDDLRLSAALTASAAAFNSQMGRISMNLGPAVTFLMSAFNFRLGLWVPHPTNSNRHRPKLPGRFFFAELLGLSNTSGKHLHLSDGNHFENYGLYELIRRHCRYIIVSDCGADVEVAFDDLANVLRRVREDFGVEIELDVSRLRPNANGVSNQHAVVGTIHYNGLSNFDKGTILFFKPVLTGDEPPDVLQYQTRNQAFPHESTTDQFYDEAQWESYRRLGEHSGRIVLGFLDRPDFDRDDTVDKIFRDARSRWHPTPEHLNEGFIAMSERCADLEESLATDGPPRLRSEFFAEVAELVKAATPSNGNSTQDLDEDLQVVSFLLRSIQVMEDVWVTGDFEQFWSHPLNQGWMSYFHRWAATPSFRRWWPILAPIYSQGFRSFVKDRFGVRMADCEVSLRKNPGVVAAQLSLEDLAKESNHQTSHAWRTFCQMRPQVTITSTGKRLFGYKLQLLNVEGALGNAKIYVGFVLVSEHLAEIEGSEPDKPLNGKVAEWRSDEFFVPPTLHGGGVISRMLDALIRFYEENPHNEDPKVVELRVAFGGSGQHPKSDTGKSPIIGAADRHERVREIEFYKSRGFRYRKAENQQTGEILLHLQFRKLPPSPKCMHELAAFRADQCMEGR